MTDWPENNNKQFGLRRRRGKFFRFFSVRIAMKYLYWPLDFGLGLLGKASVDKNGPESIMPNTKTIAAS